MMKCKKKAGVFDKEEESTTELDFATASLLNRKIAQNCITKIKDNENTKIVIDASKRGTLAKLSIYKNTENTFFKTIASSIPANEFTVEMEAENTISDIQKSLKDYDTLIIAFFVPKAKPMNNFDIEEVVLKLLKKLFTSKNCVLYVFGNPYTLSLIPDLQSVSGLVQVYQDFTEFQEAAAHQLLENPSCQGTLPVTISNL
jgi:hypothetical protein